MDPAKPVVSSGSRFVSENSIKEAQERRAQEWKKAYERLGQEAPPMPNAATEKYDPRTLYEKLQEQKDMKQAAFEDKISIRNQFRALESDEVDFLHSVLDDSKVAERERAAEIDSELAKFREAVTARSTLGDGSPPLATSPPLPKSAGSPTTTTDNSAKPAASTSTSSASAPLPLPKKKSSFQQKGLISGAIKRKSFGGDKEVKKKVSASSATVKPTPSVTIPANESVKAAVPAINTEKPEKDNAEQESPEKTDETGQACKDDGSAAKKRKIEV